MKRMSRNQRPSRQVLRVSAPNTKSAVSDYILFYFSFASGLIFNFGLHDFCFWTKPAVRRASHRTTPRLNYTLFKTLTPIFIWVIKLDSPRRSLFRYCGFCSAGVASGIMRLCASSCAGRWNYVTFQLLERWRYMLFISRITARLWIAGLRTGNYQSAVIWTRSTVRFDVHHIVRSILVPDDNIFGHRSQKTLPRKRVHVSSEMSHETKGQFSISLFHQNKISGSKKRNIINKLIN